MTVTVPATDSVSNTLQAQITAVAASIAANANPANLLAETQLLFQLQVQLVNNLMNNTNERANYGSPGMTNNTSPSFLNPATILSTLSINT
jgi:hypothetical protein